MTQASLEAYLAIQPHLRKSQVMAFEAVRAQGTATMDEVESMTGRDLHQRMSELRALGWLVETGERRGGQTVYRCGTGTPAPRKSRNYGDRVSGTVVGVELPLDGSRIMVTISVDPHSFANVSMPEGTVVQVRR